MKESPGRTKTIFEKKINSMKILCTGKSDFQYNRCRILLNGLEKKKDVSVTRYPLSEPNFDQDKFTALLNETDYVYIPPFRHSDVKKVRKLTTKPIVFDPLISKYLTRTIDYKKWWTAPDKYWRDWISFKNSDIILMDTQEDKDFIVKKYGLEPRNVLVVPIGVNTHIFKPEGQSPNEKFTIGFHGSFIPLQGMDKIIKAAHIIQDEDVIFDLVGSGPQFKKIKKLTDKLRVENVKFRGWVNYEEISPIINQFDVCLGIFGDSIKTDMVIPNKVYEYAALKKCIITKNTPAVKEVFNDDLDIKLSSNKPKDIADTIMEIKSDSEKRESIANNAYQLIKEGYDEEGIAGIFIQKMNAWESTS